MIGIYLILLAIVLFGGAKITKQRQFHEDFLSLKVSKGIQGFCAICIITHHACQQFMGSGEGAGIMAPFALIGFLFVGIFFFFSGYGL